jgi:hypothetical protein
MPDNVEYQSTTPATPAAGEVVAADEIAGAKHQRVKMSLGSDGSATDWPFGQQDKNHSAPVVFASDQDAPNGFSTGQVTNVSITTAATAIPASPLASRKLVRVTNPITPFGYPTPIYVGYTNTIVAGVTAAAGAAGRMIAPGQTADFAVRAGQILYAITSTQPQVAQVEEFV